MPRRSGRKAANSATGDASASKKRKLSCPKIENVYAQFQWRGDGKNQWIKYTKKFNKIICDAYVAGKNVVDLTLPNGVSMGVQFDKMVQKNKKTGFERSVCIAMRTESSDDFVVIQWQDDHNKKSWNPYTVATSLEIEKAFEKGMDDLTTSTTRTPYQIDLKKMTQTNSKTKFSRPIQREVAVSEDPDNDDDDDEEETKVDDAAKEEEEMEEEEEEVKKSAKKGKSGRAAKSSVRTFVVKKGSAPVDDACPVANKTCVYEAANIIWDCMLNQTNIANNNNKFYLIQLLHDESKNGYYVWLRWGRVGYDGQTSLADYQHDLLGAQKFFCKKFAEKTKNDWANKDSFVKYNGKYDLVKINYNNDGDKADEEPENDEDDEEKAKVPDSKLDKRIQDLIQLICDVKSMEEAVVEMKYDAKKAPLGKLTKEQIKAGYTALKEIEDLINKKDFGRNLSDACSEFYTRIPHEFGMQVPPLIRTPQELKKKLQLLEALEDIEIAIKVLKGGDKTDNPVDRHYNQLACNLSPLDKSTDEFKLVNDFLVKTHGPTHKLYSMDLEEVFVCDREGELAQFVDHGNRMLLWHGSRLTNWAGILSQGLRIAPPEAPVTGYMFGKGVYFADVSSKSANYCFASRAKNTGLLLLCDVSLGTIEEKIHADPHAANLPAGRHSVKGMGMTAPDDKSYVTLPDGVIMPVGKVTRTNLKQQTIGFTLQYNEFIIYNVSQIRMKYLLKVKFNFK